MTDDAKSQSRDAFLLNYDANEVRIAAEFLSNWLPFLARGLCKSCTQTISKSIQSLHSDWDVAVSTPSIKDVNHCKEDHGNCSAHSTSSTKDSADKDDHGDTHSLGSWKDEADGSSDSVAEPSSSWRREAFNSSARNASPRVKKTWADMAMEDELAAVEEENDVSNGLVDVNDFSSERTFVPETKLKVVLSRDEREYRRFNGIKRKKDFICLERIGGKLVNIVDGLELHQRVFSAAEQKRIVNHVEELEEMGRNGQLKARTYTAPQKWMRGKGRITLQFGCCYNYATDKKGNPPGILKSEMVDPLPSLFKVMIKRLVQWHVLPPSCIPDSCIVNIYEEGDCIPPHIDNHEFVRPFCTVSFLSECDILFGSNLKILGPGEFEGTFRIPLPLGSVLVLNGNGADVAKHCVPAVPSKRISITFRRMDETKRPIGYSPEPDLQGVHPLPDERHDRSSNHNASRESRPKHPSKSSVGYSLEPDLQGLQGLQSMPDEEHDRSSNHNASRESRPRPLPRRSVRYSPETDSRGILPLPDEAYDRSSNHNASRESGPRRPSRRPSFGIEDKRTDQGRGLFPENSSPRFSAGRTRQGPPNRRRFQSDLED